MITMSRYRFARMNELIPTECPCGQTRRAFLDDPDRIASFHIVDISADARSHYHRHMTELYYILSGNGELELDGERMEVRAGDAILIKPGCRHRAIGRLTIINVPIPAFDPADEWFDE